MIVDDNGILREATPEELEQAAAPMPEMPEPPEIRIEELKKQIAELQAALLNI